MRKIIDHKGMTTFGSAAKEAMMNEGMTSGDAVNVLRGGAIRSAGERHGSWRYHSRTKQMTVEFCFRGHESGAASAEPDEVVIVGVWRNER